MIARAAFKTAEETLKRISRGATNASLLANRRDKNNVGPERMQSLACEKSKMELRVVRLIVGADPSAATLWKTIPRDKLTIIRDDVFLLVSRCRIGTTPIPHLKDCPFMRHTGKQFAGVFKRNKAWWFDPVHWWSCRGYRDSANSAVVKHDRIADCVVKLAALSHVQSFWQPSLDDLATRAPLMDPAKDTDLLKERAGILLQRPTPLPALLGRSRGPKPPTKPRARAATAEPSWEEAASSDDESNSDESDDGEEPIKVRVGFEKEPLKCDGRSNEGDILLVGRAMKKTLVDIHVTSPYTHDRLNKLWVPRIFSGNGERGDVTVQLHIDASRRYKHLHYTGIARAKNPDVDIDIDVPLAYLGVDLVAGIVTPSLNIGTDLDMLIRKFAAERVAQEVIEGACPPKLTYIQARENAIRNGYRDTLAVTAAYAVAASFSATPKQVNVRVIGRR